MSKYFISVIMPIYNAEKYVKKSIESLVNQTTNEIEIILVDDGSTDESASICDQYDGLKNVKIIHKENGGTCTARNQGLEHADGKYVSFIDADDFMDQMAYEKIIACLKKTNADILDFGWRYISETGEKTENLNGNEKNILFDQEYIKNIILPPLLNLKKDEEHFIFDFSCMKIFKKEIIDKYNIRFDEQRRVWEDRIFIVEFLKYCQNYYCMDECFYNYVSVPNSLSRRYSAQFLELILANYNLYIDLFGDDYDFSVQYVTDYWCNSIENMIMNQLRVKDEHPEVIENISKILREPQVKTWYKNRTQKDQMDKEISEYLEASEYDQVIKTYEKKLLMVQKQEKKAARKQLLRRVVRKLIK
ncbi:Hyaluronan synthase [uncultured Eubacterium sp.]|nr:glycosyltransferase family 2 protein [uncultured Anaerostipes sp.]SCI88407.1 Hyaluronan synthase [uncultured Eubacterium sp.]